MCGIVGWIGFREAGPPHLRLNLLDHRGPDDRGEGRYVSASRRVAASLGSTRLAILDLSPAGRMPMEHPEEPLALVYNGEIYNFPELRRELETRGERFGSCTDTEVVLRGYRVWGDDVVARLKGMFAFALWDGRGAGRLLLARDPFGKKPLYYRIKAGEELVFSSELKALLDPHQPRHLDPDALEYYLDRGYPPPDRCLVQDYRKVTPGCYLVWEEGRLNEQRYWRAPCPAAEEPGMSLAEAGALLRERLTDATRRRMVADVPVGLLLSGGVDSSTILALMARQAPEPVCTYTACFGGAELDESELARQTALHFGARHHSLFINPRCGRLLPFVASQMDEPIADPSALATYLICRRARQEVTVLLTGDGSDELLLGYPRYRLHALSQAVTTMLPAILRRALCRFLPPSSLLERTLSAPQDPLARDRYWLDHRRGRCGAFSLGPGQATGPEAVLRVLQEDVTSWLVEDILTKLDKMSMAASVEIRAPFLDREVANLVLTLPVQARLNFWQGKRVLSEAVGDLLPGHLSWSRKKPFHLPVNDWLRAEWRPLVQDVLLDSQTLKRGWAPPEELRRLIREHVSGQASHGRRLYQLLVLELWARHILDRGQTADHPGEVADCVRELDPGRPVRRIGVIAPAGIGDTLRLTPGLRELNKNDVNVSVTLYVARHRETDQVMAGQAPVDRQVGFDFHERGSGKYFKLLGDLRRNPPHLLVSTLVGRGAWLVGAFCGVRERRAWVPQWSWTMRLGGLCWRRRVPYNPAKHDLGRQDAIYFCRLLDVPVPKNLAPSCSFPIWEESSLKNTRKALRNLAGPCLAVNAVAQASIRQRQYPLDKLARALEELLADGTISSVVLLGDQYSRSNHGPLTRVLGARCLDLSGMLSLGVSAAIMRECDAVLTIDGGLLHIALCTSLPVAVLYGPTDVYRTDPRAAINCYRVVSAFDSCRCDYRNHQGIRVRPECRKESQCLAAIPPDVIKNAVASLQPFSADTGKKRAMEQ